MNCPYTESDARGIPHEWPEGPIGDASRAVTSTRLGGVSAKPYDTLNLGFHVGDEPDAVTENRRRLLRAWAIPEDRLVIPHQTHSANVLCLSSDDIEPRRINALHSDALVTDVPGVAIGVTVADCVPVFLLAAERRAIGVVHAGWRGVLAGIVSATVETLIGRYGVSPRSCRAIIGPCIGVCCYEVSAELADAFRARFGRDVAAGRHLNLAHVVRTSLSESGLLPERIGNVGLCTACRSDLFYSHRRDGAPTGRQLAIAFLVGDGRPR